MIRRLGACVLQLAAISFIAFYLFSVAPGDFYSAERLSPQLEGRSVDQWRAAKGLDEPWPERYVLWCESALRGDFGTSLAYGVPVARLIAPRILKTALVLMPSLALGWALAFSLAAWAARRRDRILEPVMSVAGMSPEVILVSLLLWLAVWAGAPLAGAWLPIAGLTAIVVPLVFLHAFSALTTAREANFVRIARSRGVPRTRLWTRFILPAAANPLVSLLGPSLATAVGSSLVIEAMTGWPGLGPLFLEAVQARDYDVVQAVVVILAAALTFLNLAADLLLYRIDPRIRLRV